MKKSVILAVFGLVLICACGGQSGDSVQAGGAVRTISTETTSPSLAPKVTFPSPKPDQGVVVGHLVQEESGSPLASQLIYLGEYIPVTPGPGELITLQVQSSPSTTTDANGYFAFEDVPPGDYPLIVWTPFSSKVVPDAAREKALDVVVAPNKVTRLGEVEILWP